ncbi:hypothetical protein EV360DRAFT_68698 [Lentinula raphanica]|nr:hypothetical protein EV360DRAFT_68698 [Lentinula raphanica]
MGSYRYIEGMQTTTISIQLIALHWTKDDASDDGRRRRENSGVITNFSPLYSVHRFEVSYALRPQLPFLLSQPNPNHHKHNHRVFRNHVSFSLPLSSTMDLVVSLTPIQCTNTKLGNWNEDQSALKTHESHTGTWETYCVDGHRGTSEDGDEGGGGRVILLRGKDVSLTKNGNWRVGNGEDEFIWNVPLEYISLISPLPPPPPSLRTRSLSSEHKMRIDITVGRILLCLVTMQVVAAKQAIEPVTDVLPIQTSPGKNTNPTHSGKAEVKSGQGDIEKPQAPASSERTDSDIDYICIRFEQGSSTIGRSECLPPANHESQLAATNRVPRDIAYELEKIFALFRKDVLGLDHRPFKLVYRNTFHFPGVTVRSNLHDLYFWGQGRLALTELCDQFCQLIFHLPLRALAPSPNDSEERLATIWIGQGADRLARGLWERDGNDNFLWVVPREIREGPEGVLVHFADYYETLQRPGQSSRRT